jgi:hypothetical protein
MISSYLHVVESPSMDVVTLARIREMLETCTRKKEALFTRENLDKPIPREIMLVHLDVGLGRSMKSPL